MRHKWKDNICVHCGLERQIKPYKKVVGTPYSVLGTDGVWFDRVNHVYGYGWWYGTENKFERPECVRSVQSAPSAQ